MNELKLFEHPKFGQIRTIEEDGKILFCGKDVAVSLGYKDPTNALKLHCKGVVKRHLPHPQNSDKTLEMNFIPEGDIYRLAAKSELPGAEEFESWIFDEVLPSLRRTGTYSLPNAQPKSCPPKSSSIGEAASLIARLDKIMTRNKQTPEKIAEMAKGICDYCNIPLPDNFVKRDPYQQFAIVGMLWTGQGQLPGQ